MLRLSGVDALSIGGKVYLSVDAFEYAAYYTWTDWMILPDFGGLRSLKRVDLETGCCSELTMSIEILLTLGLKSFVWLWNFSIAYFCSGIIYFRTLVAGG